MTERPQQRKRGKIGSAMVLVIAFLLIGLAFTGRRANLYGFEEVGGIQFALLLISGWLMVVAIYKDRVIKLYQMVAVMMLNTIMLILLSELVIIAYFNLLAEYHPHLVDAPEFSTYYDEQPWGQTYWDEHNEAKQGLSYAAYLGWQQDAYSGELVNIRADHTRLTPNAECESNDAYTVFMFGGSTLWGYGAPDWGTIPAYVQQQLAAQHAEPVCVVNYGMFAYINSQEVTQLTRLLSAGERPDVAVFYDGINEVRVASITKEAGVYESAAEYDHMFRRGRIITMDEWLRDTYTARFVNALLPRPASSESDAPVETVPLDEAVMANYIGNVELVEALASYYGFEYHIIWQPVLVIGDKPHTPDEEAAFQIVPTDVRQLFRDVYAQAERYVATQPQITYLVNIFDDTESLRYFDYMHLVPEGNEEIASSIVAIVNGNSNGEAGE